MCAGLTSWASALTPQKTNLESRRQQRAVSLMFINTIEMTFLQDVLVHSATDVLQYQNDIMIERHFVSVIF